MNDQHQGLGLFKLTFFAIGTTLASGVFNMFGDMAKNGAGTLAVLIGWTIAGLGMYSLAICFNRLSIVRPELKSGIYAYAGKGSGNTSALTRPGVTGSAPFCPRCPSPPFCSPLWVISFPSLGTATICSLLPPPPLWSGALLC